MPVIAIVGAGPGMGAAIARRFGQEGFQVALLARTQGKLDTLTAELQAEGILARGFAADVLDRASITAALNAVESSMGAIDVLEFSPADPTLPRQSPTEVTVEGAQAQLEFYVHGAIAAVQAVLPQMLERGSGTIIMTTGGSSVFPNAVFGNIALAAASLRNWALSLNAAGKDKGVHVVHIAINAWIGNQPGAEISAITPLYWQAYSDPSISELVFSPEA
ncbi:MAG: SDR family NAD(P)-dependent oxidoreductase [Actinomycetota bacterium]|nr:SDR family NAD(P)-dependent oxidoreductase [Actinomycetota bacterium]